MLIKYEDGLLWWCDYSTVARLAVENGHVCGADCDEVIALVCRSCWPVSGVMMLSGETATAVAGAEPGERAGLPGTVPCQVGRRRLDGCAADPCAGCEAARGLSDGHETAPC